MQQTEASNSSWVQFVPALLLAALTAGVGYSTLYAAPKTGEMGVVFAPWTDQAEAVNAVVSAGGQLVNSSKLPNVLVVYAPDEDFIDRVRNYGAWFVVAARGLCGPEQVDTT